MGFLVTDSGNITLHSQAAYESYLAVAQARGIVDVVPRRKPKMVLMTTEPSVLNMFKADKIGSLFEVVSMPGTALSSLS